MPTMKSKMGQAHLTAINAAPEGARLKMAVIACDCLLRAHGADDGKLTDSEAVAVYLDAESFRDMALGQPVPLLRQTRGPDGQSILVKVESGQ